MAALLWRYFCDMKQDLAEVANVLRPGAKAFYVVGDSRTKAGGIWRTIETTGSIGLIGERVGLRETERIDVDVTTENLRHMKNAITKKPDHRVREGLEPAVFTRLPAAAGHGLVACLHPSRVIGAVGPVDGDVVGGTRGPRSARLP